MGERDGVGTGCSECEDNGIAGRNNWEKSEVRGRGEREMLVEDARVRDEKQRRVRVRS